MLFCCLCDNAMTATADASKWQQLVAIHAAAHDCAPANVLPEEPELDAENECAFRSEVGQKCYNPLLSIFPAFDLDWTVAGSYLRPVPLSLMEMQVQDSQDGGLIAEALGSQQASCKLHPIKSHNMPHNVYWQPVHMHRDASHTADFTVKS